MEKSSSTAKSNAHTRRVHGYTSPLTQVRASNIDKFGLFAVKNIPQGTVVAAWGGRILTSTEIKKLDPRYRTNYSLEIYPGFHIAETNEKELDSSDFINHSCEPNCTIVNMLVMMTSRAIKKDEELTADFTNPAGYGKRTRCNCGAARCRQWVQF